MRAHFGSVSFDLVIYETTVVPQQHQRKQKPNTKINKGILENLDILKFIMPLTQIVFFQRNFFVMQIRPWSHKSSPIAGIARRVHCYK